MYLGIEIGGTKLQFGVGRGDGGPFVDFQRIDVELQHAAEGIRRQIEQAARPLIDKHGVKTVGVGFGGPVDAQTGRTVTSHQVEGWDDFPLVAWVDKTLGLPAILSNDSDAAGLAEARFGAGQGAAVVFYSNVGSGIGGALVLDGDLFRGGSGIASELGHLRPGIECELADQTVESIASGWGITATIRARLAERSDSGPDSAALLALCDGRPDLLDTRLAAQAAAEGNRLALEAFDRACRTYGWALAQMITLVAPKVVVLGGGVSLVSRSLFFDPVCKYVDRYVFPPSRGAFQIVPAALGEEVVVHGVLALALDAGNG